MLGWDERDMDMVKAGTVEGGESPLPMLALPSILRMRWKPSRSSLVDSFAGDGAYGGDFGVSGALTGTGGGGSGGS